MAIDVIVTAQDSSLNPTEIIKTLRTVRISSVTDRDIKQFDLGVFASLMEDLLGGLKMPNYITDFGRSKKAFRLDFQLVEGEDGDDLQSLELYAWQLDKFFDVDCYKYKNVSIKIGDIVDDLTDGSRGGTGDILVRVKGFNWSSDMLDQGKIDCSLELWVGSWIRL